MVPKSVAEMIAAARERVENLTVDEVEQEMNDGDVLLVDLRESEELHQHGVIPGAVHAPRGMLEFWADPQSPYHRDEFDPSRRVILHCAGGARSALAAATLRDMGYEQVAHMDGGFGAWQQAGKPTSKHEMWGPES